MYDALKVVNGKTIVNAFANLNEDGSYDLVSTSLETVRELYPNDFVIEGVTIVEENELILFETVEEAEKYLLN